MTVTYSLSGSATPPPGPNNDYTDPAAGSVTIPAGSLSAVVTLPVVDDLTFEGTDDVTLTLGTVTMGSATVSASSGSATTLIIDNEVGPSYNPGDVIINEIMKDPDAVLDSAGEYFELYNTTGSPVDINGWTFSDNGSDSFTVSNGGPLEIPAGGYFVLGVNDDTGSNGGVSVDYEYDGSSWFLANGDDEVIAADAQGNEIDRVEYTDAFFPDQTGASLEFLPTLLGGGDDDTQNDVALNWQASQTTIGGGPDLGTPGAINSTPAPEINVTDDTAPTPLNILDGDTFPSTADGTDFGSTSVGTPVVNSFVLENEGPAPLTITGAPTFSGPDPTEFTTNLTAQTIPANSSVPFTITFLATATGTKNATINIPSDDSNENPYDFALTASAVTGLAPEITVESNFIEIVDGDTTPVLADNTDFGSSDVAVGMARETYFITNDGTADLNIPVGGITISGAHAGDFTFDAASLALPAVITPGNTVPFSVDFDPSATGTRNATVNIANDDADENPYTFDITGNGVNATGSTVLINEIDSQDPAADDEQFVELYGPAGTSLDGLALVLFNGNATGDGSYDSIDLDGLTIPDDGGGFGYIVVGNAAVANLDLQFDGDLQNGADAVALYTGDATGFPFGTTPTTTNLRDAIVYDTGAADDAALLSALGETVQFNEDANGDDDNESLQRIPNGTDGDNFTAIAPTPGAINGVGDTTPPTITDVIVSGPAWSPTFIAAAGTNGVGYSLPGASQTRALPWSNITTLTIEFSEDVQQSGGADIDSTDLSLGGLNVLDYEAAGSGITTSYSDGGGAGPYRLTITLGGGAVFAADRLVLTVADTVEDAAGNALDGEWTNNVSTESGDSTAGGDFAFNFNVLPGDADGFGSVFSNDVFATNSIQFTFAGASPSYNIFNDFDGSGSIFSNDVFFVNGSQFTFLPSGSPIPPSPPPPAASGPGAAPLGAGLDLLSDEDDSWSADAVDEALASLY